MNLDHRELDRIRQAIERKPQHQDLGSLPELLPQLNEEGYRLWASLLDTEEAEPSPEQREFLEALAHPTGPAWRRYTQPLKPEPKKQITPAQPKPVSKSASQQVSEEIEEESTPIGGAIMTVGMRLVQPTAQQRKQREQWLKQDRRRWDATRPKPERKRGSSE